MEVVHSAKTMQQASSLTKQKNILEKLHPEEKKVYQVKYASEPIIKMDEVKLSVVARALLAKIHVITGWAFPQEKEFREILYDQFTKKLVESFPNVNVDEIEYAFRNYQVKEWGKNMNLNLIAEVIGLYLEKRRELSEIEEQQSYVAAEISGNLPAPKEDPMTENEFIEMNIGVWKALKNYQAISTKCFSILLNQKKIQKLEGEEREFVIKKATDDLNEELRQTMEVLSYEKKEKRINDLCRKLSVHKYFLTL